MVRALGHVPAARAWERYELAVQMLAAYHRDGIDAARSAGRAAGRCRSAVLMHVLVAGMQGCLGEAWCLQVLVRG